MIPSVLLVALLCQAAPPRVTVAAQARNESLRYRFENPSRFDTEELVPHSFEQTYDTDNVWIRGAVRHTIFSAPATFTASFSPSVTRQADDFDTFHQPDGDVVVSGTAGNATLQSWALSESVTPVRRGAVTLGIRYDYRRDHWRFHDGDSIVTHSAPPSVVHRLVTTREFTTSQIHAVSLEMGMTARAGERGTLALRLAAAPAGVAWLTVELPDKYPGRDLDFSATIALVDAEVAYRHSLGRWSLGGGVRGERSFNWRASGQLHLSGASAFVEAAVR